jgi:catechol 2,3-dioxygenase-like lactoylglutathione lyase family enzyme
MGALIRFFHSGLTVADLERSVRFWRDGLGLVVDIEQERRGGYIEAVTKEPGAYVRQAHLQDPGSPARIELLQYVEPEGEPVRPRPRDPGTGHVAFVCADIDAVLRRVVEAGGVPFGDVIDVDAGAHKGARAVYVRDPDGHILELVQLPGEGGAR